MQNAAETYIFIKESLHLSIHIEAYRIFNVFQYDSTYSTLLCMHFPLYRLRGLQIQDLPYHVWQQSKLNSKPTKDSDIC